MAEADKAFTGSIPELYDRHLVPLIFDIYARDMARRVKAIAPSRVLETACGTGVVTRAIASAIEGPIRIVATDLNPGMLDVAQARLGDDDRVEWRQADALALPFEDASFDVVVCQFGAMFFPDKVQGFAEARRVLAPSGVFLFSVWDRIAENEFADVVTAAMAELFPVNSPNFLARTPHGHHDAGATERALRDAGFGEVQIDVVKAVSRSASAQEPAYAYCQGTPLRNEILAQDPSGLERATQHAAAALRRRFGDGPVEGKIQALVVRASNPTTAGSPG
ncbi:ubiquinone/menaquinone biosynthesis methyltransferase [Alsobacter metallidurans]|uniref:Ubiquinone/menaquinone biosynthesis methyltransferase n=1 Tax=Alsobacter metallidurans TaxID=340221 RepID=A0A917MIP0_9HYPH|nr:methyltransferase domain-containing protein [Alsobacter metallidurans]GGH12452.1 ubiquinone/menaquinone biosynthesis methyltransferase [Alsobacter metallidurans]